MNCQKKKQSFSKEKVSIIVGDRWTQGVRELRGFFLLVLKNDKIKRGVCVCATNSV